MPDTVDCLGSVFDVESLQAKFEDPRIVLRGAFHYFGQGNPGAARFDQETQNRRGLGFTL